MNLKILNKIVCVFIFTLSVSCAKTQNSNQSPSGVAQTQQQPTQDTPPEEQKYCLWEANDSPTSTCVSVVQQDEINLCTQKFKGEVVGTKCLLTKEQCESSAPMDSDGKQLHWKAVDGTPDAPIFRCQAL